MKGSDLMVGLKNALRQRKIPFTLSYQIQYCPAVHFTYRDIVVSAYYNSQHQECGLVYSFIDHDKHYQTKVAKHYSYMLAELDKEVEERSANE